MKNHRERVFNVSDECSYFVSSKDVTISFLIFFLVTNFVVGLPANLCTIWSICGGTMETLMAEIQHLSLAVCETLYCLAMPVQLSSLIACVWADWSLPRQFHTVGSLQIGLVWLGRPLFQSCICLERYIAVVHPLVFIRLRRLRYQVAGLVVSWSAFLFVLFTRTFIPQRPENSLVWGFLNMCVFIYCCFSVLFSLKQNPPGDRERRVETSGVKMKKRAFNIILGHLLCFLVNFFPLLVVYFFVNEKHGNDMHHFFNGLGIVCGLIHPILYIHRSGKFPWVREIISSIYLFFSR